MTIVDKDGNEFIPENGQDQYSIDMLELCGKIKQLVTEIMIEKELTYFQAFGAISMFQSQMTATLLMGERSELARMEAAVATKEAE